MDDILRSALSAAREAATAAATEIMKYYRGDFEVEIKADLSPVTIADRRAEEIIRDVLLAAFPDHGFFGEETGREHADADWLWLVDPIDGTKSFVGGYGMFSTQIALMHRGELVLGVSSAPAAGEVAWAMRGGGAFLDGAPIRVSGRSELAQAAISTGNLGTLARSARWAGLGRIFAAADRTRGYGDYYHYHRLAAGQLDAVIESDVNILDIAALSVIVGEAGGRFTDLEGAPPGLATTSVLAATPALHPVLLELLRDPGSGTA
jgi:histidinol-phosphatase